MKNVLTIGALLYLTSLNSYAQQTPSEKSEIIAIAEHMPSYPDGVEAMMKFIRSNLKHPKGTSDYSGTVYVQFVVNKDGSLTDILVIRGLCEACDQNAMEVIQKMPNWIPGRNLENKPIRTSMVVPVKFKADR